MPKIKSTAKKGKQQPSAAQRVLAAVYELLVTHQLSVAPNERVRSIAEISKATYPSLISRMVQKKLLERGDAGCIKITKLGMTQVDPINIPTTNDEAQRRIKDKLNGNKPRQIFDYLSDGKPRKKTEIMKAIDCMNQSTFAPLLSRELKRPGYIEYPEQGMVQLSDVCFPYGRYS